MNIRMSTKGKRPLRSLTPSDKIHAIQRIHDGESKASVARDIGVPESTLRGWCKNEEKLRFMSRQSALDKIPGDSLTDRIDGNSSGFVSGPTEKRPKVDQRTVPMNFSSKTKLDEITYKRGSINGLDYSTSKALSDLGFNTLPADYATFNGSIKNKNFGADISRPSDPSISAISPLSSLSHLSGLGGVSQSPLAISFSELTSNLNILAQFNPGLTAMSSLNELAASASLRNIKPKGQTAMQSSRVERKPGLTVKNWAKQHSANTSHAEADYGLNLSQSSNKNKGKCQSPSLPPSFGDMPHISTINEDPLLYWLKSQQAMLGLNNIYPQTSIDKNNSPGISLTPQQHRHPTDCTPLNSSSGPTLDEKNAALLTWCKAFGASLNSLAPIAINTTSQVHISALTETASSLSKEENPNLENILYSHLTRNAGSPVSELFTPFENTGQSNELSINDFRASKPEDLSAKAKLPSNTPSPIEMENNNSSSTLKTISTPNQSPIYSKKDNENIRSIDNMCGSLPECKDVLDNILHKINCNQSTLVASNTDSANDSDGSYNIESSHNNNDVSTNNYNSNKNDEEERTKCMENHGDNDFEAIRHGEKFLQWLEGCSNPRVTAVHLMQLRFLISAVKSSKDTRITKDGESITATTETSIDIEERQIEEGGRFKTRRRK